ncbi:MAG: efflux RND transporter permease subunit [Lachnospiraceae bacterium]|nr:efflux RND transporter permease subunit [Lachnospiraceae bacterium]
MDLTKLALKRPVSMFLILLALFVFGFTSITGFELERTPEMSMPVYLIMTTYIGADPESVDDLVTDPIEDISSKLEGVNIDMSISREGVSIVVFTFDYDVDMNSTYMDIQKALNAIQLPDDAGDPTIMEMQMDQAAIMTVQAGSDSNIDVVSYVEDTVKPKLEGLTGVSSVDVMGGSENYIRVQLNEEAMKEYGLTIDTVTQYVTAADFTVPAGSVEQGSQDISLSASADVDAITDLESIPVRTTKGSIVTLRDIADISYAVKDAESMSRHNGEANLSIDIAKKQSASTVTVSNQVLAALDELMLIEPDVKLEVTSNTADKIIESLKSVGETLVIGVLLSMLTLFIFFGDIRASLIVGSSMPISLFAALIAMRLAGFTLNLVTMGALVVAIGMMVDSSIVVLESCFRSRTKGLDYEQAAYMGTTEVAMSIIASTITTVVVYVPMALISGMSGQMFRPLGFTIVFAMLASLIAALTLIPLFFSRFKPEEKRDAPATRFMHFISEKYARAVRKVIPRKRLVVLVAIGLFVLAGALLMGIDKELMSASDEGQFAVTIESRAGTTLEQANKNAIPYEKILSEDEDIESYDTRVEGSTATVTAYISDDSKKSTTEKIDEYTEKWAHETGVNVTVALGGEMAEFVQSGASLTLECTDYDELKSAVYAAQDEIEKMDGVISVTSNLSDSSTQAKVDIDPKLCLNAGLTPAAVAGVVRNVITGIKPLTVTDAGDEYDVYLEFPKGRYDNLNSLMNVELTSATGATVPLKEVAEIKYTDSQQEIRRSNGIYSIEITATTTDENKNQVQRAVNELPNTMDLGRNVTTGRNQIQRMMADEFSALGGAIATAIFLVFLVMAMQFESPRFSLMVMMSIPFSLIGCFGLLFVTRSTLSMTSLMGFLMLVGIVVNNGILFVDTANRLKVDYPIEEALARSGEIRLRPILMTTLTTILSMIPMALGWGSGTEMLNGMANIIIGGLTASTLLILFLLPTFYLIFMKKEGRHRGQTKGLAQKGKGLFVKLKFKRKTKA